MNRIEKEEMYENLKGFLKTKGIELQEGSYAERIRQGCGLLTDTINLSQRALRQAKVTVDKKLDRVRQVIHEKTAPDIRTAQPRREGAPNPVKVEVCEVRTKRPSARTKRSSRGGRR
jgi:hypothetical protein